MWIGAKFGVRVLKRSDQSSGWKLEKNLDW